MFLSEAVIEQATRIFYSIPDVSGDLKVFWSQMLKNLAHDDLTDSQVEQREIIAASRAKTSFQLRDSLVNLSEVEQLQIFACLALASEKAEAIGDVRARRGIQQILESAPDMKQIKASFQERLESFNNQQHFTFGGTIRHITIDFVAKWLMLIAIALSGTDAAWNLIGAQLISVVTLYIGWRISRRDQRRNTALLKDYFKTGFWKLSVRYSRFQYTMLASYAIVSSIIAYIVAHEGGLSAAIVTFGVVCLFYYTLCFFFPVGEFTADDLSAQTEQADKLNNLDADENDEAIVRLEAELQSQTSRLEAYVLESALFGALAFSGFLQIIATNLISFSDLENFASAVFHCLHGTLTGNSEELAHYAGTLNTKESLFCLVSIETLICSGLFLAVIASRMRFSNCADSVRTSLSLAKAYNEKEEGMIHQGGTSPDGQRLVHINKQVSFHVRNASNEFRNIAPVTTYMEYFRHAGVLVFLMVLITSCLFVSTFLSWTFLAASIVTAVYFNLKTIRRRWKENLFAFKIFFASNSWTMFATSLALAVVAFFIRITFNAGFTDFFVLVSLLGLGLLLHVWLAMMPHHDKKFGDIENLKSEPWRSSRYKVVRTIYGLSVIIAMLGVALKITRISLADEILMIGLSLVGFASYPLGYYLSRPRWFGLLMGVLIGTSAMGILFKILHLPGGAEMLQVAVGAQIVFFIVFFIRRRSFHYILLRVVVVIAFSTFVMAGETSYLRQVSLMYEHADMDRVKLAGYYYAAPFTEAKVDEKVVRKAIADCDAYFAKYDPDFRSTSVHWRWGLFFERVALDNVFENVDVFTTDPAKLQLADISSAQLTKIDPDWNPALRTNVLIAMNRKKEAGTFLDEYVRKRPTLATDDRIKNLYTKINSLSDTVTNNVVVTKTVE